MAYAEPPRSAWLTVSLEAALSFLGIYFAAESLADRGLIHAVGAWSPVRIALGSGLVGAIASVWIARKAPALVAFVYFLVCGFFVLLRLLALAGSTESHFFLATGTALVIVAFIERSRATSHLGRLGTKVYAVLFDLSLKALLGCIIGVVTQIARAHYGFPAVNSTAMALNVLATAVVASALLGWSSWWLLDAANSWTAIRRALWFADVAVVGLLLGWAAVTELPVGRYYESGPLAPAIITGIISGFVAGGLVGGVFGIVATFFGVGDIVAAVSGLSARAEGGRELATANSFVAGLRAWFRHRTLQGAHVVAVLFIMTGLVLGREPGDKDATPFAERIRSSIFGQNREGFPAGCPPACNGARIRSLGGSVLRGPDLHGATLVHADVSDTTASRVDFSDANMSALIAKRSIFPKANMRNANLSGADFRGSILFEAAFAGAVLDRTNLSAARLEGVDFSASRVFRNVSLKGAIYDARTRWPSGIDPLRLGARMSKGGRRTR